MTAILETSELLGRASVPASHSPPLTTDDGPLTTDNLLKELPAGLSTDSPDVFLKAAINIASVDFFTVLNRFDTAALTQRLNEKPELYFQLMNSFCNLLRLSLEQQKLEFRQKQAEARQRERNQKLRARKPILITAAAISSIHSSVGRGAWPAVGSQRRPDTASQATPQVVPPLGGSLSVSSASSVLNTFPSPETELAQIVAAEFALSDTGHSREDSEPLDHHEIDADEILIGCPS